MVLVSCAAWLVVAGDFAVIFLVAAALGSGAKSQELQTEKRLEWRPAQDQELSSSPPLPWR